LGLLRPVNVYFPGVSVYFCGIDIYFCGVDVRMPLIRLKFLVLMLFSEELD
jgi:hypothetical protein